MKRVDVNDAASICALGNWYFNGENSLPHNTEKAIALWTRAAELGYSKAHYSLGCEYHQRGDLKEAKFHFEAAAMAVQEVARNILGVMEAQSGNMGRAIKHWSIAASAGNYKAMHNLRGNFEMGHVSRDAVISTLASYNNSFAEMRSEARDACIRSIIC